MSERSKELAQAILDGLDEPKSAERIAYEEEKERRLAAEMEEFYIKSGQKPPRTKRDVAWKDVEVMMVGRERWEVREHEPPATRYSLIVDGNVVEEFDFWPPMWKYDDPYLKRELELDAEAAERARKFGPWIPPKPKI